MVTTENPSTAALSDAESVAESLAGGREAFRQIVDRHQTLVCSLAYCATGSLSESEDLAQETFLAAWRLLPELREPSKLRPWLCGIARFIIGKELRRERRDPVHGAETQESLHELAAPGPLPWEDAISKEEQEILWHCVARIPEIYREPLVLYYREHQSVELVAEALELSNDAVKQRLSRGRKLLQEQVLTFVESALRSTNPGQAFTVKVLSALPLSATSAKAVAAGTALKSSPTFKIFATLAVVGATLFYWSTLVFLALAGVSVGLWMSRACAKSSRQCENVIRFWRTLAWSFAVCFVIRGFISHTYMQHGGFTSLIPVWPWVRWFYGEICPDVFLLVIVAALALWMRHWWVEFLTQKTDSPEPPSPLKRQLTLWLSLGMIGPACLFAPILGGILWSTFEPGRGVQYLSNEQMQKIVEERKDAFFNVTRDEDGTRSADVVLPENNPYSILWKTTHRMPEWGVAVALWTGWLPIDTRAADSRFLIKLLDEKGIHYSTASSHSFSREGWPFKTLLPFFIAPMGAALMLRQLGRRRRKPASPGVRFPRKQSGKYDRMLLELRTDSKARRVSSIAFVGASLFVFGANAATATKVFTGWGFYVVFFLGSIKGVFFGLVAALAVLYLRSQRKASKTGVKT